MKIRRRLPQLIALLSIALALLGVVMVYSSSAFQIKRRAQAVAAESASAPGEKLLLPVDALPLLKQTRNNPYSTVLFFGKQLAWSGLGLLALIGASRIDYPRWQSWARPIALGSLACLVLVWSPWGKHTNGATSWLNLRWFTIQPAEFAKLALVIFLADLLARRQQTLETSLLRTLPLFAIPGLFIGLVLLQPDLGMATLMVLLTVGLWFLAGIRIRHMIVLGIVGAALLAGIFYKSENARARIEAYWNPEKASAASRYQIEQAEIAIANGGLWGVGLGDGQQKMHFLPAPHTDFIFAVLAEELGLFSCLAVLLFYAGVIATGFYVSLKTPDLFGTFLAGGLTLMMGLGVLINIAVVTGSIPTTGLPLPLLSYGGSSLLSTMLGLGIMVNVSKNLGGVRNA